MTPARTPLRPAALFLALACATACGASTPADTPLAIDPLPSPATGAASAPQLTSDGSRAILSWLEEAGSSTSLRFAERTASGWSGPRTVVSGGDLVTLAADVPTVYPLGGGALAAQWLERLGPNPAAYALRLSFSDDSGRSWSAPVRPHSDDTPTQHGFASLFSPPDKSLGIVWLDGRSTDPDKPEGEGGDMALWSATFDAGRGQQTEVAIDDRACDCCHTSTAHTSSGPILAYRDRSPAEVRDIVVSRFESGAWTAPAAVHEDGWTIHGCPVNGPAIDARGEQVVVAWFTGSTGQGRILAAFSRDGGRTFLPPVRVDGGFPRGRVDVALLDDDLAAVSWTESAAGRPGFMVRRLQPDRPLGEAARVADVAGSDYPRMALTGGELLFAWVAREGGGTQVSTARAQVR